MHMFWECPVMLSFGTFCMHCSDVLHLEIPKDPLLFLLLDDSTLQLNTHQKRTLLAAGTAVKKDCVKAFGGTIQRWNIQAQRCKG